MPDTLYSEIDIPTAVTACQRESEKLNRSLKLLGYQLQNCQICIISEDCDWSMRSVRLQSGKCLYIVTG